VELLPPVLCMASPLQKANDNQYLYVSSFPLAGTRSVVSRFTTWESNLSKVVSTEPPWVGGSVRWRSGEEGLDTNSIQTPHKLPRALSSFADSATFLLGSVRPACSGEDRQNHCDFTHKQRDREGLAPFLS
ncbi:hypothetical protein GOODEAATRI_016553, partial [Goodea atripinnis]